MTAADKQLAVTDKTTSLSNPKDMIDFATTLANFIAEKKLFTTISNKAYVHVEAWQFCGAAMGVMPIVRVTERILTDNPAEYKYRVEVELKRLDNGDIVGSGVALCTNLENKKRSFDEYAVASMAQTRAIGKAYRNAFGWLMKVAGYQATPFEEMDGIDVKSEPEQPASRNVVAENAKYMNMKPSDTAKEFPDIEREYVENEPTPEPPTKLQIQRIKSMMKGLGFDDGKIAEGLMKIETAEDAERALTSLKKRGGE